MTDQTQQATGEAPAPEATEGGISLLDMVVLALCAVGVVVALVVVFDYSGITLFDSHAADVIADAWNRNATIGLAVVIVVAFFVGVFVWMLAKSTLGSDRTPTSNGGEH